MAHYPIAVILFVTGCLTPIDRFSDYTGRQVVITGQISSVADASVVSVAITSTKERLPEPVQQAVVTLIDNSGNRYAYTEHSNGTYLLEDFQGTPGSTYHLSVTLPDGRRYESVPERMPQETGVDEVYYVIEDELYTDPEGAVVERPFLKVFTNATLPSSDAPMYIKWDVQEAYILSPTDFPDVFGRIPPPCYIIQKAEPQKMNLFINEQMDPVNIADLQLVSRLVDRSFKERHYFSIYQSSMTYEAYEYWRKVDVIANQVGSIFDAPPARIKGNIHNVDNQNEEVHGYFQAVNQTLQRFYLLPEDLPFKMPLHCEYRDTRPFHDYPAQCLDCISVPNSSYTRPDWF
jgi:hypothetical protein